MGFQNGSFMTAINGSSFATSGSDGVSVRGNGITAASLYDPSIFERKGDYQKAKDAYDVSFAAEDAAITDLIDNFRTYIELGQEDKAMEAYHQLLEEMSNQGRYAQLVDENGNDKQLRAMARKLIESSLGEDASLSDFIRENTRDSKGVQAQQIMWGEGHCDSTSMEDLLAETCNLDQDEKHLGLFGLIGAGIAAPFTRLGQFLFGDGTKH